MSYYLGLDAGGTKTTAVIGDETAILATAESGPANIVRVGEAQATQSLHECVHAACAAAKITPAQITQTCIGAAGAARPEIAAKIRSALAGLLPGPITIVGDMEIALEAAFGAGPGVIVIAGTGSIAYGRDANGKIARAGGWGFAVSDEGSAHWIGRLAISVALHSHDTEQAVPPLLHAIMKSWHVHTFDDLVRAANATPPPNFAALFPVVLAHAESEADGALAHQVLHEAGRELAQIAVQVMHRLFPETDPVRVAMAGGVFRHAEIVRKSFYTGVIMQQGRVQLDGDVVEPVHGALCIARRNARKEKR